MLQPPSCAVFEADHFKYREPGAQRKNNGTNLFYMRKYAFSTVCTCLRSSFTVLKMTSNINRTVWRQKLNFNCFENWELGLWLSKKYSKWYAIFNEPTPNFFWMVQWLASPPEKPEEESSTPRWSLLKFSYLWIIWITKRFSTRMRFELTRAEHNRLAVCRLNHSATSSFHNFRK